MKIDVLYVDGQNGASGDMLLSALIAAGYSLKKIQNTVKKLNLQSQIFLESMSYSEHSIQGQKLKIKFKDAVKHRSFHDIQKMIQRSPLSAWVQKMSLIVFRKIAEVEASIHQTTIQKVHFHEVGALDSILDIVAFIQALEDLGKPKCFAGALNLGGGHVSFSHGSLVVPAPATAQLIQGWPVFGDVAEAGERLTPTAAAIIVTLFEFTEKMPLLKIKQVGYGYGQKPGTGKKINAVALYLGYPTNLVSFVEECQTNIDDMNPEHYEFLFDRLFSRGALDVWLSPCLMKKNRPAQTLHVLYEHSKRKLMHQIIFQETTTFGVRYFSYERNVLKREKISVMTDWGKVQVKLGFYEGELLTIAPEYESCKKLALKKQIPIKEIYQVAIEKVKNSSFE